MALRDRITEDMKSAMRAGEKERLAAIRLALAAIKQREVDERITLDDGQVLAVLDKMIKQRREAITQFESGGRADLVARETAEITVLQGYLPAQMSEAEIDALIVEVIGARVQLKKAGREYKACCPFHNEKTPSFWVSPDKQFYHCFGCGKPGTVLGFLMDHDHMAFPEAVEVLATRLGLEVPHEGPAQNAPKRADEPLYELMARVAAFYRE